MGNLEAEMGNTHNNSMRFIMSVSFIVLIIITYSIIGYFVFSSWRTSAQIIITKVEDDTNRNILNQVNNFINTPLSINEANHNLIQNGVVNLQNKQEREMYFVGVIKSSTNDVYSFSYGTENGEYYGARRNGKNELEIMENNSKTDGRSRYYSVKDDLTAAELVEETEKFDPRTRSWYKAGKEKKEPVFSPIYKHFVMEDLAISAAYPVYSKNSTLLGVLGTHITLSKINNYLKEIAKEKNADVYIIERVSGELVANSYGEKNFVDLGNNKIKRIAVGDIDNKIIIESYENFQKDKKNSFILNTENDRFHVTLTNYKKEGVDWLVITSIPESQFTAEITKNIKFSIFLSIVVLIIAIIIFIKSMENLLKPIYFLINTTEEFSKGDFSHRAKIYRNDEIGKLSSAFNNMAEQLYTLINRLEEKVKGRTVELEKTNLALKNSEGSIHLLLDSTAEAIYGIDINGNCTFCNASCLKMLRYQHQNELIGKNMHSLIHYNHIDGIPLTMVKCEAYNVFAKGECTHVEDVLWRSDGTCFPVEYFSHSKYSNGEIIGAVFTFIDITERKKSQEDIIYLSYHDQLTGLYNRRYFDEELIRLDCEENLPLTIIMGDVNGLKLLNDSFGHGVGDELLKKVAEVLTKGCRVDDIIARLGGDEFVVLLPNTDVTEANQIIKRIIDLSLSEKVGYIDVSISLGQETKSNAKEDIQEIFKNAEDHMYKIKIFEGPSMRGKTIKAIINALYMRNIREEEHSRRVSVLCESMGKALCLHEGEIEELIAVGLLHDIGKIDIDEGILNKPGKLTDDEWNQIKRHPEVGYRILSTVNDMSAMAQHVLFHHEEWDGSGYPKGSKEVEIPLQSRIIAVADAYAAMTSERSYSSALSKEAAIEQLLGNSGTQFDPELVKTFIEKVLAT